MKRFTIFLLIWICLIGQCQAQALRACGGDSTWPPMSYLSPKDRSIQGFSVEVLKAIFEVPPKIQLRPWARCLAETESLQASDIVMSIFRTPEREKSFLFSRPFFKLTPAYFYAKRRFPTVPIQQKGDLSRYHVCSLHGAAISYTGLRPEQIESGATNYLSLFRKVERGHCDIVVDMQEVFFGFDHIGSVPFAKPDFEIRALPNTEPFPLHFAVSIAHPKAHEIVAQIDLGIQNLKKTGKLKQLQERFQSKPTEQTQKRPP